MYVAMFFGYQNGSISHVFNFQHQFHDKIDKLVDQTLADMQEGLVSKLTSILEVTLSKLSRYDEGSFFAPILSLTVINLAILVSKQCLFVYFLLILIMMFGL